MWFCHINLFNQEPWGLISDQLKGSNETYSQNHLVITVFTGQGRFNKQSGPRQHVGVHIYTFANVSMNRLYSQDHILIYFLLCRNEIKWRDVSQLHRVHIQTWCHMLYRIIATPAHWARRRCRLAFFLHKLAFFFLKGSKNGITLTGPDCDNKRDTGSWVDKQEKEITPLQSVSLSLMCCRFDFLYVLLSLWIIVFILFFCPWLFGCGRGSYIHRIFLTV